MIDTNIVVRILKFFGEYSKQDSQNVQRNLSPDEEININEVSTKDTNKYNHYTKKIKQKIRNLYFNKVDLLNIN